MAKTILSVDDSASMRQMIKMTLAAEGYNVIEACDGREGLSKAQAGGIDLVLTDLNMPNLDGLGFIRELRKLPTFKGVPIIFLTTESDEARKSEAKAAGATGWIVKPFERDKLLAVVKRVFG